MKHCLYVALVPVFFSACNVIKSESKPVQIGICTNLANREKMQQYGYAYVEEGVSRFLVPTKPEGGEIVKEIHHRHFMLLADLYPMKMENEGPENIVKYRKLIKHIHIAEKQDRAVPGTYDEDFRPYFNALKKIGYTGKISIEARWRDFDTQIPVAMETIKRQLNN